MSTTTGPIKGWGCLAYRRMNLPTGSGCWNARRSDHSPKCICLRHKMLSFDPFVKQKRPRKAPRARSDDCTTGLVLPKFDSAGEPYPVGASAANRPWHLGGGEGSFSQ